MQFYALNLSNPSLIANQLKLIQDMFALMYKTLCVFEVSSNS